MEAETHRIVVVGGGYAGATAAVRAAGKLKRRAQVTMVDPTGTLVQRLRLHQMAAGQEIAELPLEKLCGRRVEQVRGWAEAIDPDRGAVSVRSDGPAAELPYDSLVIAAGSTVDPSVPGGSEHAHSLADADAALRIADAIADGPAQPRIAVVGAGFTGIEAATELAQSHPDARVSIVSSEPFAGTFSPKGRKYLLAAFARYGIEILDGVDVQAVQAGALEQARGPAIPFDHAVWCGGFTRSGLAAESGLATGPEGGALVDRRLRSVSHPEVLVVGDAAECPPLPNGARVRMCCAAGMPTGAHAADVIAADLRGREEPELDVGYAAWNVSLGRGDALVQWLHRDDRPRERITSGRRAAWIKELATGGARKAPGWERRFPGAIRWLGGGAPPADAAELQTKRAEAA